MSSETQKQWPGYVLLALAIAGAIAVGLYDDGPEIADAPPVPPIPATQLRVDEPIPAIPPMKVPPPPPR